MERREANTREKQKYFIRSNEHIWATMAMAAASTFIGWISGWWALGVIFFGLVSLVILWSYLYWKYLQQPRPVPLYDKYQDATKRWHYSKKHVILSIFPFCLLAAMLKVTGFDLWIFDCSFSALIGVGIFCDYFSWNRHFNQLLKSSSLPPQDIRHIITAPSAGGDGIDCFLDPTMSDVPGNVWHSD